MIEHSIEARRLKAAHASKDCRGVRSARVGREHENRAKEEELNVKDEGQ